MSQRLSDPRSEFLAHQDAWLAPYALHDSDSLGRAHAEPEHPYRTAYQRDRDRIIHCSAFRRLDYKTQVFVPHEQDHCRTRLTHTLEVAQVARTLARALRANEDAAEAVALAHDLGHPPFGHAGEAALAEIMSDHGHFEHNRQSLRVVDYLEHPYGHFRGLNLTGAVRRCLAKHTTRYDCPALPEFDDAQAGPLEGQLVDLADEIAYTSADLADALSAGWLTAGQLAGLELWRRAWERVQTDTPGLGDIHLRIQACRAVLVIMSDDVIAETGRRLAELNAGSFADVQAAGRPSAAFSDELAGPVRQLQDFLLHNVYLRPEAARQDDQARRLIGQLFAAYLADPALLPQRYTRRMAGQEHGVSEAVPSDRDDPFRVVCDYVAGMTDRFCRQEQERLTGRPL